MNVFRPQIGDLVLINQQGEENASIAFVGAEREDGFLYEVYLVHAIDDMAGPLDLVIDDQVTNAGFRFVLQMDSVVTVLREHLQPSPWYLKYDILEQANDAYAGNVVNEDEVWTGLPYRGQLDQRLDFKDEQAKLGDRLSEMAVATVMLALVIDPLLAVEAERGRMQVSDSDAANLIFNAPSRAKGPDSATLFEAARVKSSDKSALSRELSDWLALAATTGSSKWATSGSGKVAVYAASGTRIEELHNVLAVGALL